MKEANLDHRLLRFFHQWECLKCNNWSRALSLVRMWSYGWGEPAVSYRWTGWVWEIIGWSSSRLRRITDHFRGISRIYPNLIKENRRMSTCNRLDLHTLGSQPTGYYAQKSLPVTDVKWPLLFLWLSFCDCHELEVSLTVCPRHYFIILCKLVLEVWWLLYFQKSEVPHLLIQYKNSQSQPCM